MKGKYLICKRGLYYGPDSCGYTGIKSQAGLYTEEEAKDHADEVSGVTYIRYEDAPDYAPNCFNDYIIGDLKRRLEEQKIISYRHRQGKIFLATAILVYSVGWLALAIFTNYI